MRSSSALSVTRALDQERVVATCIRVEYVVMAAVPDVPTMDRGLDPEIGAALPRKLSVTKRTTSVSSVFKANDYPDGNSDVIEGTLGLGIPFKDLVLTVAHTKVCWSSTLLLLLLLNENSAPAGNFYTR